MARHSRKRRPKTAAHLEGLAFQSTPLLRYRCSAVAWDIEGIGTGDGPIPVETAVGRCSLWITLRLLTTVDIACLKINCSWLLFSRSTEYLSKDRIFPVSLTPLTK
jgi:hypothetical protein